MTEPAAATAEPVPILAGTFAIYPDPSGGVVLVTDIEGQGVKRQLIPAGIVKMALNAGDGKGLLGRIVGKVTAAP